MKNSALSQRVVLILLLISLLCTCMTGCQQTKSVSSYFNSMPTIDVGWVENKQYPINAVTLEFSIGIYDIFDIDRGSYLRVDGLEFYGIALYFCGPDLYENSKHGEALAEDRYLENYHYIKEIPAEECLSYEYGVWTGMFNMNYRHTEELFVPRELLEEYVNSICIKLLRLGMQDDKVVVYGPETSIILNYQIINHEYVIFRI